jgi:predicted glycogen debranching enzyme
MSNEHFSRVTVDVHRNVERARREWLCTNGAGAYAASTICGAHSRRYHGLLVASLDPPRARHVLLSAVDATVMIGEHRYDLSKHQFPGVDPSTSPFYLERFELSPLPTWTYSVGGATIEVTLGMARGQNATVLRYLLRGDVPGPSSAYGPTSTRGGGPLLTLRPLLAARNFHHLQHENGGFMHRVELRAGGHDEIPAELRVKPTRDLPRVVFGYQGTFLGSPDWWRRFEYLAERDRGLDFHEDLWTPGVVETRLVEGVPTYLVAAVEHLPEAPPSALLAEAEAAIYALDPGPSRPPVERTLAVAADAFRCDLAAHPGVLAGYPWFEVWGRDTLIALPGLYLVPERVDGAVRILKEMIGVMQDGLVPNRIPDAGEAPEFHTADATLWLFEAARLVADKLGEDHPFVKDELLTALRSAFDAALRGTRNNIRITPEGLFAAGHPGDSLTWMDARVDNRAITSRVGCPVELSALWAKGCETLVHLARAAGDSELAARAVVACHNARRAFRERFFNEANGFCFDVLDPDNGLVGDPAVRCNAILALAVDPDCFTLDRAHALLERARNELVTPAGVRTLSPYDPQYKGRYRGGVLERDSAYHQGTVWQWPLGFYVRAAARHAKEHAGCNLPGIDRDTLRRLVESAATNALCVGQVAEIADGDAPHAPNGCFAQAWSVSELYRALAWDLA